VSEPRVSVLIPVYNGARYLGEALASALSQRPGALEVIVVDDGSSDSSAEVARSFDHPVRCISLRNGGIARARNAGLAESSGDFVAFLDADDVWTPGALSALLAPLLADSSVDLVFGHVREFVSEDCDQQQARKLTARPGLLRGFLTGSLLARRTAFESVGGFREDIRSGEFLDWIARSRHLGRREALVDDQVLWRRIHGDNHGLRHADARSDYALVLKSALDRRRAAGSS